LFKKGHDAIADCINMVSSSLWPSARLTMETGQSAERDCNCLEAFFRVFSSKSASGVGI